MTKTGDSGRPADAFEIWRQLYDTNERAWTAALEQAMGSPEFGESSGKLLETMLAAQKSIRDSMRTYLESMNVPTREDIARLGELVVGLEEKIDQVGDRLDTIEEAIRAVPAGASGPAGPTGATGRVGPKGPAGRVGPKGPAGAAGRRAVAAGRAAPAKVAKADATTKPSVTARPAKAAKAAK